MIVIEVVLYINSMLTDIHAIKEEEVFVLKKSKNQKTARAMKKKRNKEDCEEKGSYLSNYSSVLLFSKMKKKDTL